MRMMMNNYATVRDAIDAINGMTDDMGPFGIVTLGSDEEEGAGVNVEEPMSPEIGAEAMPDMMGSEEFFPEEEIYT